MTGATARGDVLVAGIDVGTKGARVVVLDLAGKLAARASEVLPPPVTTAANIAEQDPEAWWGAVCRCFRRVLVQIDATRLCGLAVSSTSGTLVLTDENGRPLRSGRVMPGNSADASVWPPDAGPSAACS